MRITLPCHHQSFLPSVRSLTFHLPRPRHPRRPFKAEAVAPSIPGSLAESVRPDFPILNQEVNGKPLIYFDNAATSQKPSPVIEAMDQYYTITNSNVHRGVHALSTEATTLFENARAKVTSNCNSRVRILAVFRLRI